jgi:gamma-glutamyltranspeptidase/glutathione hydrolase
MPGELFKNPNLANTFRTLAKEGKKGFYSGRIAEELVKVCQDLGGHMTLEDLKQHLEKGSESVAPISKKFNGQNISKTQSKFVDGQDGQDATAESHGVEVWEHPPNGQGIVALMALGILEELEANGSIPQFQEKDHNTAPYIHAIVEALRIAFADASWWVTDPNVVKVPTDQLISKAYLAERAKIFDPKKASPPLDHGSPAHNHSDTVYFAVTDSQGNGISFINSNYAGFGSGIIPKGCGFTLQNRGSNFELQADHPNVLAPNKRPYHTIIPAMITNIHDGSLHSVYGVMGGFMQPQGHVQVLLNMLAFKMHPQAALDAPRVCIGAGMPDQGAVLDMAVYLEEGISEEVVSQLREMGHKAELVKGFARGLFGRGQVIRSHVEDGQVVYSGGSDPRGDGAAYPA